jgi:chemotaxis protein CheC
MTEKIESVQSTNVKVKDLSTSENMADDSVGIGILSELASIGAGHAATSLSEILQQQVMIDVPRIHNVPAHLLPKIFGLHEMPTTALYIQLASGSECDILLMLEADEARKIAAMMSMVSSVQELDPSMESSAIEELANILVGSFLSAISDFVNIQLVSAPPERIVDAFDAILDNIVVKNALLYHDSLLFDLSFRTSDTVSKCLLLLFPSPDLQRLLVEKSKVLVDLSGASSLPV